MENLKKKMTCELENDMNMTDFQQSTWKSQNSDSDISFNQKKKMYELKISRGVMCHDNEKWRGIDLLFQNWHEFWPKYSNASKIFTLIDFFWAKHKLFELEKYRGDIFHYSEKWCKISRGIGMKIC